MPTDVTTFQEKMDACRETGFDERLLPILLKTCPASIKTIDKSVLVKIMTRVVNDDEYKGLVETLDAAETLVTAVARLKP